MVKIILPLFALFLLLMWSSTALAEPSLQVQLKKTSAELGKPVYLKIIGQGLKTDLSLLSLQALNQQFFLDTKDLVTELVTDSNNLQDDKQNKPIRRQTLNLKLYPRMAGELLIAPFSIDKFSSREQRVLISDASTRGKKISFDWTLSSSLAWQREQIIVSLTLTTPEQFANIKLDEQPVNGFEITPLAVTRLWEEDDLGGKSTITAGWSLLPLKSGKTVIDLPAIKYHLNGVTRRTFYLPEIMLNIRPLASYLPPTIAVGKLKVESSIKPAGILKTGELAYWNISVESNSLTPYWLPPLLRQLKSNDNIQFFPASSTRSMNPDSKATHARVSHSIPFKPLNNGVTALPNINIQYFDPETGRLESILHQAEQPLSMSSAMRILPGIIFLTVLIFTGNSFYQYIHRRIQYKTQRQYALRRIQQSRTNEDVLTGLRLFGKNEGWPENVSLSDWLKHWQAKYQAEVQMDNYILLLSDYCYGRVDETQLKSLALKLACLLKISRKRKQLF